MQNVRYWIILALETIGAGIILIRGIPVYKGLLFNYENFVPAQYGEIIAVFAVLLIQVPHWYKQRKGSIPVVPKSNVLSTLIAFISRLFFIFAAALFSVFFFIRYDGWDGVPFYKFLLALTVVFSIFCYCRDLEELSEDFKKVKSSE